MPGRNVGGYILLLGQEGAITSAQATLHTLRSQTVSLCLGGDISLSPPASPRSVPVMYSTTLVFSHPSTQANELHVPWAQPAQK